MSLRVVSLSSLLFFAGFATAGIFAPNCTRTGWEWSYNSLGQNACKVAAYMLSTCYNGSFTVPALPPGYIYSGPSISQGTGLCICNTVTYCLISACGACQGEGWLNYWEFHGNCTAGLPPGQFPNPVPAGTLVPRWALIDVTAGVSDNQTWDPNAAKTFGDTPEVGPGTKIDD